VWAASKKVYLLACWGAPRSDPDYYLAFGHPTSLLELPGTSQLECFYLSEPSAWWSLVETATFIQATR